MSKGWHTTPGTPTSQGTPGVHRQETFGSPKQAPPTYANLKETGHHGDHVEQIEQHHGDRITLRPHGHQSHVIKQQTADQTHLQEDASMHGLHLVIHPPHTKRPFHKQKRGA